MIAARFLERYRRTVCFLGLLTLQAGLPVSGGDRTSLVASGLRVVVLEREDQDAAAWTAIARTGANVVATLKPPSPATDAIASEAGLDYLAFLTTAEIEFFAADPVRIAEARSERRLAGFYYWDAEATEGFTTPEAQRRAYTTLKFLFPDKLVLYPTRLDPIAWKTGFLDDDFRPEFTDLVTPYFYPVGATVLGQAQESDAWEDRLAGLLSEVARRVPEGKGVLPVLQAFQQDGYPVGAGFPSRQMSVYRQFWPGLSNAAVYAWKFAQLQPPLVELADLPTLQRGVCVLFANLLPVYARCRWGREIPFRGSVAHCRGDAVLQDADPFDLDFDCVAGRERADAGGGAGQDEVAGEERHHPRDVGDEECR